MFLSDFTESKIELVGHIVVIDGKRYITRGFLPSEIDVIKRLVYVEGAVKSKLFHDDCMRFDEVDLIPLFATGKEKKVRDENRLWKNKQERTDYDK